MADVFRNGRQSVICMEKKAKKSLEFEGTTVEDAIQTALAALSVPRENIEVKVLCEESKGLFGMEGAQPAKIKVYIKK